MINVVIADDEPKVRQTLIDLIDWYSLDLSLFQEVDNGDSLYEIIKTGIPEIAIIDMKMPGLSGTELVRKIAALHNDMKLIIVSGYDDYAYMKEAINSKVAGYILKPVDKEELQGVLVKCIHLILEETEKKQHIASQNIAVKKYDNLMKNETFWDLLENNGFTIPLLRQCVGNSLQGFSGFRICIIKTKNHLRQRNHKLNGAVGWLTYGIQNIIDECFETYGKSFYNSSTQNIALFLYAKIPLIEMKAKLKEARHYIQKFFNIEIYSGISSCDIHYNNLNGLFTEALYAVMHINILEDTHILTYNNQNSQLPESCLNKYLNILSHVSTMDISIVFQAIFEIYRDLQSENLLRLGELLTINRTVTDLLLNMRLNIPNTALSEQLYFLQQDIVQEIDISQIEKVFKSFFNQHKDVLQFKSEAKLAQELKKNIEQNIHLNISMDELAQKYNFSKQYLFRIFKQAWGISPHQYMLEKKIEKAKILLLNPEIKSTEIVELLAFNDESHFSKVFKKITGISPREYRISVFNREDDK